MRYTDPLINRRNPASFGGFGTSSANGVETILQPVTNNGRPAPSAAPVGLPPQLDATGQPIAQIDSRSQQEQQRAGGTNLLSGSARATRLGAQVQSNVDAAKRTDEYKLAQAGGGGFGFDSSKLAPNSGINAKGDDPTIGAKRDAYGNLIKQPVPQGLTTGGLGARLPKAKPATPQFSLPMPVAPGQDALTQSLGSTSLDGESLPPVSADQPSFSLGPTVTPPTGPMLDMSMGGTLSPSPEYMSTIPKQPQAATGTPPLAATSLPVPTSSPVPKPMPLPNPTLPSVADARKRKPQAGQFSFA